jgi:hypothetical protein
LKTICKWEKEERERNCVGKRHRHWHSTRLKFEDNPEEDETWIQREFIQD